MKVIATDADQPGIPNSQIFYTINPESNPDGLFYINSITGEVLVQQSSLDREVSGLVVSNVSSVQTLAGLDNSNHTVNIRARAFWIYRRWKSVCCVS